MREANRSFLLVLTVVLGCSASEETPAPGRCQPADCSDRGLNCGPVVDESGACLSCGSCVLPEVCGGGGQANVCACPRKSSCGAGDCGTVEDGCGGTLECGDPCVLPLSCGGGPEPGRCGRRVAAWELCDAEGNVGCRPGYLCCISPSNEERCLPEGMTGACPELLPDLVPDEELFRRSIKVETVESTGDPTRECNYYGECMASIGQHEFLSFDIGVVNRGVADLVIGIPDMGWELFSNIECFPTERARLSGWRLLRLPERIEVLSGERESVCVHDDLAVLPHASSLARFDVCTDQYDFEWGIQVGWVSRDQYGDDGDCRFIEVGALARGEYEIELTVDHRNLFQEIREDNNTVTATVTLR